MVLWLVTVILGLYSIWAILDVVIALILLLPSLGLVDSSVRLVGMTNVARWSVLIVGGAVWLLVTIGGLEYHFKRIGQPESWRLFAWTIGLELALIAPGLILRFIM